MEMKRSVAPLMLALLIAAGGLSGCTTVQELRLRPEFEAANRAFEEGDYALAATRYESLSDRYPSTTRRQQMLIQQGIALYTIASYHDARNAFLLYVREFPEGLYLRDARSYLGKIDVLMSGDSPAKQEAIEAAKKDLNQLQQLHIAHPHDPAVTYAIGNLYYELGNYDEAVRYYYDALTIDAAYKEKTLIKERVMLDANGQPRPATPNEIQRLDRENRPLVIFNTHNYTARDPDTLSSGQQRFYNVTGLIRNQSSRLLQNVEIDVQFLNTQNQVLDIQTVLVGSLGPDEVRPFRAEADAYDNLYNITSFECIPHWEQQ